MLIEAVIISIVAGLIQGGKITNLGRLNFKYFYLILAAYIIQKVITYKAFGYPSGGYSYLHIFSYFILFFVLWQNRRLPGMYIILIGTLLNFMVIALNGGQMPVSPNLLPDDVSQTLATGQGGTHNLLTENTRMKFLADIFYITYFNQKQLFSVGDIVMDAGVFLLIFASMKKAA